MWRSRGGHYIPGPTAAGSVHLAKIVRRAPVAGVCRAPVPVRRRRVVRRRHALPLVEAAPEGERRIRQPGLGALSSPHHGLLVFLSRVVNTSQCIHSVHVPLHRRRLQTRHALRCLGLAPANVSFGQVTVPTCGTDVTRSSERLETCQGKVPTLHPPWAICRSRPGPVCLPIRLTHEHETQAELRFPVPFGGPLTHDLGSEASGRADIARHVIHRTLNLRH
jgi:hypothetical protein